MYVGYKMKREVNALYTNIFKDEMRTAYLFGTPVLYTTHLIPREDVPEGWHCYDLRGTVKEPNILYAMVDSAPDENRLASVLSRLPLKNEDSQRRLVRNMLHLTEESITLPKFCEAHSLPCPEAPFHLKLRPASPEEAGFFYALPPEKDEELGAIGHVRIDFGSSRSAFHHTWWPRGPEELNTQEFRDELNQIVADLRKSVLKSLGAMRGYCWNHDGKIDGGACCQNYGYVLETERYTYRLRCNPTPGDYQAYLSCFVNQEQKMGLTEDGRQKLGDAANPERPHRYDWYVMDACNTPEEQFIDGLPLEDAIQRYIASEQSDKRLGVTKDDISAVDLLIRHDGRDWVSEDWTKDECFSKDPVVAEAVTLLQQTLEEQTAGQDFTMGGLSL